MKFVAPFLFLILSHSAFGGGTQSTSQGECNYDYNRSGGGGGFPTASHPGGGPTGPGGYGPGQLGNHNYPRNSNPRSRPAPKSRETLIREEIKQMEEDTRRKSEEFRRYEEERSKKEKIYQDQLRKIKKQEAKQDARMRKTREEMKKSTDEMLHRLNKGQSYSSRPPVFFTDANGVHHTELNDESNCETSKDQSVPATAAESKDKQPDSHQCFTAGTLVFTPDQEFPLKPIESLTAGDHVWSCNTNESQCVVRTIENISVTETNNLLLIHVRNSNGTKEVIQATPDHPFYKENETKVTFAKELKEDDFLWTYQERVSVTQIEFQSLDVPVAVYNFQVKASEGNNNYFVGEHLILVHNCNIGTKAAAFANGAWVTCAASTTVCAAGLGATGLTAAATVASGGVAVMAMPAVGGFTAATCGAAAASCGVAGVATGVQNVFSAHGGESDPVGQEERRAPTQGDKDFPSERAARKEALRRYKVETSKPNSFEREDMHGSNPNLKGPKGEPSEILKAKDVSGKDVTIPHHKHGHKFKDNGTFEKPHYHGPKGEHLNYD